MSRNPRFPFACEGDMPLTPAELAIRPFPPAPPEAADSGAERWNRRDRPRGLPRSVTLSLRWRVLKRDNFRCVACGRSPATEVGCQLHVDHIVPSAHGGENRVENLRTLCAACNQGRGSRG